MGKKFYCKIKFMIVLEQITDKLFSNVRMRNVFLNIMQNPETIKEKTVKFAYIKIQNACMAKTITKAKRQMFMCMEVGFDGEDSNL